jgi:hypothetical protein
MSTTYTPSMICTKCSENLPLDKFSSYKYKKPDGSTATRKYTQCNFCRNKAQYERRKNNPEAYERLKARWRRKAAKQKEDRPDMFKKRLESYKESGVLKGHHLKRYGVSLEQYLEMLRAQDYKCLICEVKAEELDRDLCVDHCHTTGKIRGLLCNSCNTALGLLKEREDLILKAIEYIKK